MPTRTLADDKINPFIAGRTRQIRLVPAPSPSPSSVMMLCVMMLIGEYLTLPYLTWYMRDARSCTGSVHRLYTIVHRYLCVHPHSSERRTARKVATTNDDSVPIKD